MPHIISCVDFTGFRYLQQTSTQRQNHNVFQLRMLFSRRKTLFLVIKLESDAWVAKLLEAIQAKLQSRRPEVDLEDLRIFKVRLFFFWQTAN